MKGVLVKYDGKWMIKDNAEKLIPVHPGEEVILPVDSKVRFHLTFYCQYCNRFPQTDEFCEWNQVAEKICLFEE